MLEYMSAQACDLRIFYSKYFQKKTQSKQKRKLGFRKGFQNYFTLTTYSLQNYHQFFI